MCQNVRERLASIHPLFPRRDLVSKACHRGVLVPTERPKIEQVLVALTDLGLQLPDTDLVGELELLDLRLVLSAHEHDLRLQLGDLLQETHVLDAPPPHNVRVLVVGAVEDNAAGVAVPRLEGAVRELAVRAVAQPFNYRADVVSADDVAADKGPPGMKTVPDERCSDVPQLCVLYLHHSLQCVALTSEYICALLHLVREAPFDVRVHLEVRGMRKKPTVGLGSKARGRSNDRRAPAGGGLRAFFRHSAREDGLVQVRERTVQRGALFLPFSPQHIRDGTCDECHQNIWFRGRCVAAAFGLLRVPLSTS
eukprot:PhM_4_TR7586/c0_g1_i1/m.68671